jgi:hypothetical protein
MPKYCSPRRNKDKTKYLNSVSCFNKQSLLNIARAYNSIYPDFKIDIPRTLIHKDLITFWNRLRKKINEQTQCSSEMCWIETVVGKEALSLDKNIKDFLRPLMPKSWNKDPIEWLSTIDIEEVLNQYNIYGDFIFIGAVPIDFDTVLSPGKCVINELCNINIKSLYKKGVRKIGIVFNLDKHTQEGSHWISLFISIKKGSIFYFDSYGYPPNKEISTLIHRIRKMMNELFISQPSILRHVHVDSEITNIVKQLNTQTYQILNNIQADTPVFYKNRQTYKPITISNISAYRNGYKIKTNIDISDGTELVQKGTFVFYNSKRYQFKTSACGMYSIIFIIELLKNKSIYQVLKELKYDDDTEALRTKYFRPNQS